MFEGSVPLTAICQGRGTAGEGSGLPLLAMVGNRKLEQSPSDVQASAVVLVMALAPG